MPEAEFYVKANGFPLDEYLTGAQAAELLAAVADDPQSDLKGDLEGAGFRYQVGDVPGIGPVRVHVYAVPADKVPEAERTRLAAQAAAGG
jgi:hypothetical protein